MQQERGLKAAQEVVQKLFLMLLSYIDKQVMHIAEAKQDECIQTMHWKIKHT